MHALSLRQPWATLLVHGLKTIEIRNWQTARRGRVLIHAARIVDDRAEAWRHVPAELMEHARLTGGILGEGSITRCCTYRSLSEFQGDQEKHLNEPGWFRPPVLYGFAFSDLTPLPFHRCSGWMRFFEVEWPPQS